MKIKLSKSQWESVGKKAGWIKESQEDNPQSCSKCVEFVHYYPPEGSRCIAHDCPTDPNDTCDYWDSKDFDYQKAFSARNLYNEGASIENIAYILNVHKDLVIEWLKRTSNLGGKAAKKV